MTSCFFTMFNHFFKCHVISSLNFFSPRLYYIKNCPATLTRTILWCSRGPSSSTSFVRNPPVPLFFPFYLRCFLRKKNNLRASQVFSKIHELFFEIVELFLNPWLFFQHSWTFFLNWCTFFPNLWTFYENWWDFVKIDELFLKNNELFFKTMNFFKIDEKSVNFKKKDWWTFSQNFMIFFPNMI